MFNVENERDDHGECYSEFPPVAACEGGFRGCEGDGERCIDPFVVEIVGERVWIYLCGSCYTEKCMEI